VLTFSYLKQPFSCRPVIDDIPLLVGNWSLVSRLYAATELCCSVAEAWGVNKLPKVVIEGRSDCSPQAETGSGNSRLRLQCLPIYPIGSRTCMPCRCTSGASKLPQRGPGRKRIWCTLKLPERHLWQSFWAFWSACFTVVAYPEYRYVVGPSPKGEGSRLGPLWIHHRVDNTLETKAKARDVGRQGRCLLRVSR